jgi:hypothetical protein
LESFRFLPHWTVQEQTARKVAITCTPTQNNRVIISQQEILCKIELAEDMERGKH